MRSTCVFPEQERPLCACETSVNSQAPELELYDKFRSRETLSELRTPKGMFWATPVRVDALGANLESYRVIYDEIEEFRDCVEASQGTMGKLPLEVMRMIEDHLMQQTPEDVRRVWHDIYHCAHGQCSNEHHLYTSGAIDQHVRDFHDWYCDYDPHPSEEDFVPAPYWALAGFWWQWDRSLNFRSGCRGRDTDYEVQFDREVFYKRDDDVKDTELDHVTGLRTWLRLIDQKPGGYFHTLGKILKTLFGLEVLIVNELFHDTYDHTFTPDLYPDSDAEEEPIKVRMSVVTSAYLYLPFTSSPPSASPPANHIKRTTDHFVLFADPALEPQPHWQQFLFKTAMEKLELEPWVHPMQYAQLYGCAVSEEKSKARDITLHSRLRPAAWPQRVVLVGKAQTEEEAAEEERVVQELMADEEEDDEDEGDSKD